ncbi:MAG: hypothetical protein K2Q23_01900, partial [Bryobacteraceae bacterium]|nr:hypothetical protein [Bryobacteraceae bacterium]
FGPENWRLVWKVGEAVTDFVGVCALYEDAYFNFMRTHPSIVERLIHEACDVYDDDESNVDSQFDYSKQETERTHIQDIAVRRCLLRMGRWFKGERLVQIRGSQGNSLLSELLSPGRVPFHRKDLICTPEKKGFWWKPGSVESFYQSNRVLQIKLIQREICKPSEQLIR